MSPACEIGLALMLACASPGQSAGSAEVNRACTFRYTKPERHGAMKCASENGVPWKYKQRKRARR